MRRTRSVAHLASKVEVESVAAHFVHHRRLSMRQQRKAPRRRSAGNLGSCLPHPSPLVARAGASASAKSWQPVGFHLKTFRILILFPFFPPCFVTMCAPRHTSLAPFRIKLNGCVSAVVLRSRLSLEDAGSLLPLPCCSRPCR